MTDELVEARLLWARLRLDEYLIQNGGDIGGADIRHRDRPLFEFFFHLVGSIEFIALYLAEKNNLQIPELEVNPSKVAGKLTGRKATLLHQLWCNPNRGAPTDLYSDKGMIYRIWNYRHQSAHRGRNYHSFFLSDKSPYDVRLQLDPRDPAKVPCKDTIYVDLPRMMDFVELRVRELLALETPKNQP